MATDVSSDDINEHKPHGNSSPPTGGKSGFGGRVWEQDYWIQCEVVLSLLTVFAVYAFICIARYTSLKKSTPSRDTSGKQGRRLYLMLIVVSGFAVLRFVSDHVVAFTSSTNDTFCFTTIVVSTVMYALGLMSVYIFLWMRQSIFYANPVLSKVLNKGVTIASWSTLVVMILCGVCLTVLYNLPQVNGWVYQVTEDGCKGLLVGDDEIVAAVATALTVYFQISLLALFLYPLLSRKTQKYRSAGAQNNGASKKGTQQTSISNTDDNLTDGDISNSAQSPISKFKISREKKKDRDYPPLSENESGVDVRGTSDSGKYSESSSNGNEIAPKKILKESSSHGSNVGDMTSSSATEKTKISGKQKRPSLLFTPRFLKAGNLFYRRNQGKPDSPIPQSPTAKRSRAKTLSTVSTETEGDRNNSVGTQNKRELKKKQRRAK